VGASPASLAEHTSGFLRGQVVVAGGDCSGETSVQGINVPLNAVTTFNSLPSASDDAVGGVIGNTYYILGGNNGATNTPQVLIGTPTPESSGSLWLPTRHRERRLAHRGRFGDEPPAHLPRVSCRRFTSARNTSRDCSP
jgi:hypothetical protein